MTRAQIRRNKFSSRSAVRVRFFCASPSRKTRVTRIPSSILLAPSSCVILLCEVLEKNLLCNTRAVNFPCKILQTNFVSKLLSEVDCKVPTTEPACG